MRSIGVLIAHDHHLPIPQALLLQTLLIGLREVQSQRLADADHLLVLRQLIAVTTSDIKNLQHMQYIIYYTRNEMKERQPRAVNYYHLSTIIYTSSERIILSTARQHHHHHTPIATASVTSTFPLSGRTPNSSLPTTSSPDTARAFAESPSVSISVHCRASLDPAR